MSYSKSKSIKNSDHKGGELVLKELKTGKESIVEPRKNRAVIMTAGEENIFHFKNVTEGDMYLGIYSFTCDYRRNINSEGKTSKDFLPFGPIKQPKGRFKFRFSFIDCLLGVILRFDLFSVLKFIF